jgi:flagellar hook-length control protein FliK
MDATQVVMAHIASDTGLDAVAMRTTAISDSANRSMLDTGNTMFGPASSPVAGVSPPMQSNSPIVATPLSSPAWSADFSQQFISMTRGRDLSTPHTIELRLDPPSLGPVRITLQISDSIAQAAFVSPHAAVRQAIENALPSLQQQLADAGLSLGQASVNDQSASQQGFEQSSSHGGPDKTAVFSLDGHAAESPGTLPPPARQTPRSPDALVDTFA